MICCTGCSQSVPQKKKLTLSNPFAKDRPQRAARMTCMWEAKTLAEKQGITRGFQGEIIFFRDDKMQESVMVDGELTVYVYDADDRQFIRMGNADGLEPLCAYKFPREILAKGFEKNKKTKMMSYGVWLPFDKMPGDERNLVLCARFDGEGKHGELLGGEQITVYLPGNPVPKKKQEQTPGTAGYNGIMQASYSDINDFSTAQQSSYAEAVRNIQNGNRTTELRREGSAIPLSPALARRIFNAPQEPVSQPETPTRSTSVQSTETQPTAALPRETTGYQPVSIGFGGGESPAYENMMLARNRQNITSVGSQIDQRMQNSQYGHYMTAQANNTNLPQQSNIQQVAHISQNQPVNAQGFTDYNANSFATDQNRFNVPDRYESWGGVPVQGQNQWQQAPTGQPQDHSAPYRLQVQNPNTSQSAYVPSDWGPGLESMPSGRETQVLYSTMPGDRTFR